MTDDHSDEMDMFDEQSPRPGLVGLLLGGFASLLHNVVGWWLTRRWGRFFAGLPAVAMVGVLVLPTIRFGYTDRAALLERYKHEVRFAIMRDDVAAVDVYSRKALQLAESDQDVLYAVAYVAQQRGETALAARILTELASRPDGHPKAHLWRAKQLLAAAKAQLSPSERRTIEEHLRIVLKTAPDSPEANVLLGQMCLQSQDYRGAIRYFQVALPRQPELHLSLGQAYLHLGEDVLARRELQDGAELFQGLVEKKPDDVNARVAWALAVRLQDDFANARQILDAGLAIDHGNETLRGVQAAFCIDEFDSLPSDDRTLERRLQLLDAAIRLSPEHPAALNRLATLASGEGPVGDEVRAKIQDVLVAGKATATIHLILAIQAITRRDIATAELHLEQGYRLNPDAPILLNNLAWLLANQDPPQLARALELVNKALERLPDHPNIRETRGQIAIKLGKWQDALADLEFALPHMSGNRELHAALARVYRELGHREIAEKHQRQADGK